MTKREIYTSLSRGVALDKVFFDYTKKLFTNFNVTRPVELKVKVNNDIDEKYKNSKIYKITFENKIYIGITIRTLEERFDEHKKAHGGSNFIQDLKNNLRSAKIELLENFPCTSLNELLKRERETIEKYAANKDLILLNTCHNRKKVIKETVINQERLDQIDDDKNIYDNIVEVKNKNILRFKTTIDKKQIDISVSYNKISKEEAIKKMKEKIKVHYPLNAFTISF